MCVDYSLVTKIGSKITVLLSVVNAWLSFRFKGSTKEVFVQWLFRVTSTPSSKYFNNKNLVLWMISSALVDKDSKFVCDLYEKFNLLMLGTTNNPSKLLEEIAPHAVIANRMDICDLLLSQKSALETAAKN